MPDVEPAAPHRPAGGSSGGAVASRAGRRARDAGVGFLVGALLAMASTDVGIHNAIGLDEYALILPIAALAAVVHATVLRPLLWVAAAVIVVVVVVAVSTPVMAGPATALVRRDPIGARPADAVVVLSGAMTADGLVATQGIDRLLTGMELARRGVARTLVVTEIRRRGSAVSSLRDQRRLAALGAGGVPLEVVGPVHSTRDEAMAVARRAADARWRGVVVVTSPVHSSRACATFERAGLVVTCVPSDSRDVTLRPLVRPWDRIRAVRLTLYEHAAWALYRARGWV